MRIFIDKKLLLVRSSDRCESLLYMFQSVSGSLMYVCISHQLDWSFYQDQEPTKLSLIKLYRSLVRFEFRPSLFSAYCWFSKADKQNAYHCSVTPRQGTEDKLGWRNSPNSQTSETINLSANCMDRSISLESFLRPRGGFDLMTFAYGARILTT